MANLNGQYLDSLTLYKGLINIGSTVGQNVTASLQSLTDGDNNNLPIQVGIGLVGIEGGTINFTTGTNTHNVLSQTYTINNTGGTNTIRGIYLNAIETSITGTTHNLMDLQVGGVSRFSVNRTGSVALNMITSNSWIVQFTDNSTGFLLYRGANRFKISATGIMTLPGSAYIGADNTSPSARLHVRGDGTNPIARFENGAGVNLWQISNSGLLQAGGTTNAFPALKRSSASLQAKLADDSDFAFIQGKLQTENTYEESPSLTPTGFILLYDATGAAYRVLVIPA